MSNEKLKIQKPFNGNYPISFYFGEKPDWYIKKIGYPHNGIDWAMPEGVEILACSDGVITYADNVPDTNGCGVNITHSWGLSQYWHLKEVFVKYGEKVQLGQKIGLSGKTGFATGPHLHFGVKVRGDEPAGMRGWSNPISYLTTAEPVIVPTTPTQKIHIVKPGETLWGIATKYYGKGWLWKTIYNANRDKIKDPNVIRPLQILTIPV